MLRKRINDEMKAAMLNKDSARLSTIRLILSTLKDKDIASRTDGRNDGIADDAILQMMQSMIKQRRESAEAYMKGNRPELADKENAEIAVITEFLPKQMSDDEVNAAIAEAIKDTGAASVKDMGKVIGALKGKYAGQMDFGKASAAVKSMLG